MLHLGTGCSFFHIILCISANSKNLYMYEMHFFFIKKSPKDVDHDFMNFVIDRA